VPAFGYRCYQIAKKKQAAPEGDAALPVSNTIENSYYRIEVDPDAGAIKSVFDKQLNREVVDAGSPYRFNQYLYVSGGDGETQIVYLRKSLPLADLKVSAASGGRVTSVRKTPFGEVLTYHTSGSHASSIETDIMLFDDEKKIELVNRVHKQPSDNKEAVYFAFPVAAEHAVFSYEIQNGWVDPARDMLKGANVGWFTVQHWVKVDSGELSVGVVPIDSPLITLGDINRGNWPEKFESKSGTIFSYAMNNYWHTNFRRVQSGDFTFRYVITSGGQLSPGVLARAGRSAMTPIESRQLISNDKFGDPAEPLTPEPTGFLQADAPNVEVVDWKMAEDGQGTVLRLLETAGESARANLTFPLFTIDQAWLTNAAEENQSRIDASGRSLTVTLNPHEIVTLRLVGPKMSP
jgi:alpha-mannosidase